MYINDDFMAGCDCPEARFERFVEIKGGCSGNADNHGCGSAAMNTRWGLRDHPLAMVYSPIQEWRDLYDLETGFCRGTIFTELDLPFVGCKGCGGVKNG